MRASIDEMREDLRGLTGRVEELEHNRSQQQTQGSASARLENEIKGSLEDNDRRSRRMEEYLNLEPIAGAATPESKIKAEDRPAAAARRVTLQPSQAVASIKANPMARRIFEKFIARYPKPKNADNAQFWIGEIYYRDKWYEKAILEYQKVIEIYPDGNKVPASLLKQGLAFFNIGDKVNARLILEELMRKYPKTNEANVASKKLQSM